MAKKSSRIIVALKCSVCKQQNYVTEINKVNTTKLEPQNKYCKKCRKSTEHTMTKDID